MDNDSSGIINAPKIAEKIGLHRTYVVQNNNKELKDANDFLISKPEEIKKLIENAKTIPESKLITFESMKDTIKERLLKT